MPRSLADQIAGYSLAGISLVGGVVGLATGAGAVVGVPLVLGGGVSLASQIMQDTGSGPVGSASGAAAKAGPAPSGPNMSLPASSPAGMAVPPPISPGPAPTKT